MARGAPANRHGASRRVHWRGLTSLPRVPDVEWCGPEGTLAADRGGINLTPHASGPHFGARRGVHSVHMRHGPLQGRLGEGPRGRGVADVSPSGCVS